MASAIQFGTNAWVDTIQNRMKAAIVAANITALPASAILHYDGEPTDLLEHPAAKSFAAIAPLRLPPSGGEAGGGKAYTTFDGLWRLDLFRQLLSDQEFRSPQLLTNPDRGLSPLVRAAIKALQLAVLDESNLSAVMEPIRLVDCVWNPRQPKSGWAWCRTVWSVKFRTDLTV